MSILIPGMEMPKPGRYEAVIIVLDKSTAEIAISPAEDDIGYWKEYPLIPVQEHGRLCNKDDVLKVIDNLIRRTANKEAHEVLKWAKDCLSVLPTIIPADPADEE